MTESGIAQRHCRGDECRFKNDKDGREQLRCSICCIWHHAECVSVKSDETAMIWTCFECRQLMPSINALQGEIETLKENQRQMMDMLQRITKCLETEENQKIKAEEELIAMRSQLSDLTKQLTNGRSCAHERTSATPATPSHQAPPSTPPLRNLLLGRNQPATQCGSSKVG